VRVREREREEEAGAMVGQGTTIGRPSHGMEGEKGEGGGVDYCCFYRGLR
jgi:hypothetical protein